MVLNQITAQHLIKSLHLVCLGKSKHKANNKKINAVTI